MKDPLMTERAPVTYRDAGVDIDAGDELVERIKPRVKRSMRPEVLGRHRRLWRIGRGAVGPLPQTGAGIGNRWRRH